MYPIKKNILKEAFRSDAFEFYNRIENIAEKYEKDLTKIIYKCNRMFPATIVEHKYFIQLFELLKDRTDFQSQFQIVMLDFFQNEYFKIPSNQEIIKNFLKIQRKIQHIKQKLIEDFFFNCQNNGEFLQKSLTKIKLDEIVQNQLLKNKEQIANLYKFQCMLLSSLAGITRSILLSGTSNNLIHPLLFSISLLFQQQTILPKIAFLNFDGKQNLFNPSFIESFNSQNFFYFSLQKYFLQSHQSSKLSKESQVIEKLFYQSIKQTILQQNRIIISTKLKYLQQTNCSTIPQIFSSSHIYTLFFDFLLPKLQKFQPQLIILSYNGQFNILNQHFNNIIKSLTILSCHRIILFCNKSDVIESNSKNDYNQNLLSFIKITAGTIDFAFEKVDNFRDKIINMYLQALQRQTHQQKILPVTSNELTALANLHDQIYVKSFQESFNKINKFINQTTTTSFQTLIKERDRLNLSLNDNLFLDTIENKKNFIIKEHFQSNCYKKTFIVTNKNTPKNIQFCFNDGLKQDIHLSDFSQVIYNEETDRIIILNYLTQENDILMLASTQAIGQNLIVNMEQINKQPTFSNIFINYSQCSLRNKTYLFWPSQWNLVAAIQHKLLGKQYKPQIVEQVLCLQITNIIKISQIHFQMEQKIIPRKLSACFSISLNTFFIFGGLSLDNRVLKATVISVVDENKEQQIILLTSTSIYVKSKMNYQISKLSQKNIILKGGNYQQNFQISSTYYQTFIFDEISTQRKQFHQINNHFIVQKQINLKNQTLHLLNYDNKIISMTQKNIKFKQAFNQNTFLHLHLNENKQILTEKIYLRDNSPELMLKKNETKTYYNLELQKDTDQQINNISYIVPKESAIISLYMSNGNLFILATSPSFCKFNNQISLFFGKITQKNFQQTIRLSKYFNFFVNMNKKTIFQYENKICIFGGITQIKNEKCFRFDYIIVKKNGINKLYKRTIISSKNINLLNPICVISGQNILLFSIQKKERNWIIKRQITNKCFKQYCMQILTFNIQTDLINFLKQPTFKAIICFNFLQFQHFKQSLQQRFTKSDSSIKLVLTQLIFQIEKIISKPQKQFLSLTESYFELFFNIIIQIKKLSYFNENYKYLQKIKFFCLYYYLQTIRELNNNEKIYLFIIKDKLNKNIVFLELNHLRASNLRFTKVTFENQIFICKNSTNFDQIFQQRNQFPNFNYKISPNLRQWEQEWTAQNDIRFTIEEQ